MDDFVSILFCVSKISMVPFTAIRTILINKLKKGECVLMTELVTLFLLCEQVIWLHNMPFANSQKVHISMKYF